jgi:adenosylmethionine-8-amino-7-oxononanoate aminotransferase
MIKGEGIYVFDDSGKKYLDAALGLDVLTLRYNRKDLSKTLRLTRP